LAGLNDSELDEYLTTTDFSPLTTSTLTTRAALEKEIAQIRSDGYATSRGEVNIDGAGVAAPILNPDGKVIACLSITAPSHRVDDERLHTFVTLIRGATSDAARRVFGPHPG